MGKGGFRRDASSKMLNHNRPRPVQESQENGKAPPAFRSLEGSCGEMDRARPPRRNRNRESVHAGPDSEAGGSWDQHWYSSEPYAEGTALTSMVTSSFPAVAKIYKYLFSMRYQNVFDFRELFLTLSSKATYCLSELEASMGRRNIKSHSTSHCIFLLVSDPEDSLCFLWWVT